RCTPARGTPSPPPGAPASAPTALPRSAPAAPPTAGSRRWPRRGATARCHPPATLAPRHHPPAGEAVPDRENTGREVEQTAGRGRAATKQTQPDTGTRRGGGHRAGRRTFVSDFRQQAGVDVDDPGRMDTGMHLDREHCVRAVRSKDARFDGWFFTAVLTTRIY